MGVYRTRFMILVLRCFMALLTGYPYTKAKTDAFGEAEELIRLLKQQGGE